MTTPTIQPVAKADAPSDFDFFMGSWTVLHRRLKARLAGSNEWIEFDGTSTAQPLLSGRANVDDNFLNFPEGPYRAVSLRSYDPERKLWSIWWLDSRTPGRLDPPVVGSFINGVGTFFADDEFEGRPIKVRFRWTDTDTERPHWEQAFSGDGGITWETNWLMDFTRKA